MDMRRDRLVGVGASARANATFPSEEALLVAALGAWLRRLRTAALCGGVIGFGGGCFMQACLSAASYPLTSGGGALGGWRAFIGVSTQFAVLGAVLAAALALRPHAIVTRQPWKPPRRRR
jgi:hypothetical protein